MIDRTSHEPVLDPYQLELLDLIEPHTEGYVLTVTRGHSTPLDQLHAIAYYAMMRSIKFPEFDKDDLATMVDVDIDGRVRHAPRWLRTWGKELNIGLLINPPFAAAAPYDYIKNGVNKKGQTIRQTTHVSGEVVTPELTTWPIDFSGKIKKANGTLLVSVDLAARILAGAKAAIDKAHVEGQPRIRGITIEHGNDCAHVDTW